MTTAFHSRIKGVRRIESAFSCLQFNEANGLK